MAVLNTKITFTGLKIRLGVMNPSTGEFTNIATVKMQSRKKHSLNIYWGLNFHKKKNFVKASHGTDISTNTLYSAALKMYHDSDWVKIATEKSTHDKIPTVSIVHIEEAHIKENE